jgi:hypothetical protein
MRMCSGSANADTTETAPARTAAKARALMDASRDDAIESAVYSAALDNGLATAGWIG